jgi:hypothetical protein
MVVVETVVWQVVVEVDEDGHDQQLKASLKFRFQNS